MMNIVRKITASLLLFFMLFCMVKNTALLSLYELNQDLFITILCENKLKPALKCNGKCQLSKIALEQQKDQAAKVLSSLQTEIFFFHQQNVITPIRCVSVAANPSYGVTPANHYRFAFFYADDKPPKFFS